MTPHVPMACCGRSSFPPATHPEPEEAGGLLHFAAISRAPGEIYNPLVPGPSSKVLGMLRDLTVTTSLWFPHRWLYRESGTRFIAAS